MYIFTLADECFILWCFSQIDFYGILRPIAELARDEAGR